MQTMSFAIPPSSTCAYDGFIFSGVDKNCGRVFLRVIDSYVPRLRCGTPGILGLSLGVPWLKSRFMFNRGNSERIGGLPLTSEWLSVATLAIRNPVLKGLGFLQQNGHVSLQAQVSMSSCKLRLFLCIQFTPYFPP